MRVALLVPQFLQGKGGAEKVAAQVANLVRSYRGEATVLAAPSDGAAPTYALSSGVGLKTIRLKDDRGFRQCRGEFDLMIGFGMAGIFGRIPVIAGLLDVPFVLQECTNPQRMVSLLHIQRQDGCQSLREAFWLRHAVFAHANAIRFTVPNYAQTVLPLQAPFAYAFYNSLSKIQNHPPKNFADRRKIVCVGAMKNENKNGLEAVRSFIGFAENNRDWSLHLYGTNSFRESFEKLLTANPQAVIVDHGIVDDIRVIYDDAALLIIPSFEEGLPNVVVEAFSHGVPCIGFSDCMGVNHLIEDRVRGRLVDRKAPRAVATAMEEFASDGDVRSRYSKNCWNFASQSFRMENFEQNWLSLLENALAGRNNAGARQPRIADGDSRESDGFRRLVRHVL